MTDQSLDLKQYGIAVGDVWRNAAPARLYEAAVEHDKAIIAASGALVSLSGSKTGRSPKDKRIVKHPASAGDIWWGDVNLPLDQETFETNRERAIDFLNFRSRLYVVDGFAGWSPKHRLKVRVICARPYHAMFMHNMLIRPTAAELADFGEPDFVIYNAGEFPANLHTRQMTSKTSVDLNFESGEFVMLGTEYAGEMKKGVFTIMNYLMPKQGVLSMHCSANAGRRGRRLAVLWSVRHRQDHAFRRSPAAVDRRRRALLERRRGVQYRRRLLCQVHQSLGRARAAKSTRPYVMARCWRT